MDAQAEGSATCLRMQFSGSGKVKNEALLSSGICSRCSFSVRAAPASGAFVAAKDSFLFPPVAGSHRQRVGVVRPHTNV